MTGGEPTLNEVQALPGLTLIEFGTDWCGHCQAARPLIDAQLQRHPAVRHIRVEDGKGRPLGRAFKVKLWPTIVLLKEGHEVGRAVRPTTGEDVQAVLGAEP